MITALIYFVLAAVFVVGLFITNAVLAAEEGQHTRTYKPRHAAPSVRRLYRVRLAWDALTIRPALLQEA